MGFDSVLNMLNMWNYYANSTSQTENKSIQKENSKLKQWLDVYT